MERRPLPRGNRRQLRSIRETRTFVNGHRGVRGVRVKVQAADGIPAAAAMGKLLRPCHDGLDWEVTHLVGLEKAGDLDGPLSSARRSLANLVSKVQEKLVCAVAKEDGAAQGDGDGRAAGRIKRPRHGAQGDGAGRRLQRGRHAALDDHVANVGVSFADCSSAATITKEINDLLVVENSVRMTECAPLQVPAAALSDDMHEARLLLRHFATGIDSLEKSWAKSSRRRSRSSLKTTRTFRKRFDKMEEHRKELHPRLEALDRRIRRFLSEEIRFVV